ncbi:MAG: hypothetical protein PHD87_08230 [Candidatus Cloacimonetes bacterium]|jgi:hypothetical protein|nr:hypothetical protein [Candidatus Cloacimonadota bacterium]MDD4224554.1 hypothetical protein [Candidatus Cloacimonadota bacterium]
MSKKRFEIVEELDPASIGDVPEVHKKHYAELGYKPYRMGDGRVKWLTEAEKAYNKARGLTALKLKLKKTASEGSRGLRRKRRHRRTLWTFLAEHWVFLAMAAIILIVVLVYMRP